MHACILPSFLPSIILFLLSFQSDLTPPKLKFVGKLQYQVKRHFKINWNSSEEAKFECAVDSQENAVPCGKGWFGSWSRTDLPDGKHSFWVRGIDVTGNVGVYRRHPFDVGKEIIYDLLRLTSYPEDFANLIPRGYRKI